MQQVMDLRALQDLLEPFQGLVQLLILYHWLYFLIPAAQQILHLLFVHQADEAQAQEKSQNFGFVAVSVAPEIAPFLAVAHFVAIAAVAFAVVVAAAPAAVVGDTAAAFASVVAVVVAVVAFDAVGVGAVVAAFAAAVATEADVAAAVETFVAVAAAGDDDAFVAAASVAADAAEFWVAQCMLGRMLLCCQRKLGKDQLETVACWA